MVNTVKEIVFVAGVIGLACLIWQAVLFLVPPNVDPDGNYDKIPTRCRTGPSAWDVQFAIEGRMDGIE